MEYKNIIIDYTKNCMTKTAILKKYNLKTNELKKILAEIPKPT